MVYYLLIMSYTPRGYWRKWIGYTRVLQSEGHPATLMYESARQGSTSMKLEGTFETIPLRELIDMTTYSSVTGVLNIYAGQAVGHLYLRDGNLYHCDFCGAVGVDALAGMLELTEAGFSFVGDVVSEQESLWGDMGYHLQMAERLAYRWQGVRAAIPSLDLVPIMMVTLDVAISHVGPTHHHVLERIDGTRSLKSIAADLSWAEIDLAEAVSQMIQDHLIEFRHTTQQPSVQATDSPRSGLFDRLRSRLGDNTHQMSDEHPRTSPENSILNALRS